MNQDNDLLQQWEKQNKDNFKIITYGMQKSSHVKPQDINLKESSSEFTCCIRGEKVKIKVPVGGEHFILNSLCAICVGEAVNMETEKIVKGIEEFRLTKKRMEIIPLENDIRIINDAYNASFESMQASLKYLAEFKENRKIAVLGDMLELGEYAQQLHEQVGEEVYKNKIDILISSGKDAKYIAQKAKEKGMTKRNIFYFEKREDMEKRLKEMIQTGDVILLKASNGMKFFDIVEELRKKNKKN